MLGLKDTRAKYIAAVLADPQRPFIWEFFRPGTIPLAGERAYYDEVCLINSTLGRQLTRPLHRNEGDHSSQSLSSVPFLSTSPRMGFKHNPPSLILVMGFVQLVRWLLQQLP